MTTTESTGVTVTRHRIEATATVTFDPDDLPVITSKGNGRIDGCQFALSEITFSHTAMTCANGEVLQWTSALPRVHELVRGNGDELNHSDWRFLSLPKEDYPAVCAPTIERLRTAVTAFHPDLTLKGPLELLQDMADRNAEDGE